MFKFKTIARDQLQVQHRLRVCLPPPPPPFYVRACVESFELIRISCPGLASVFRASPSFPITAYFFLPDQHTNIYHYVTVVDRYAPTSSTRPLKFWRETRETKKALLLFSRQNRAPPARKGGGGGPVRALAGESHRKLYQGLREKKNATAPKERQTSDNSAQDSLPPPSSPSLPDLKMDQVPPPL